MDGTSSASYVCTADVAAFVDALETINCNEAEVWVKYLLNIVNFIRLLKHFKWTNNVTTFT